MQPLDPFDDPAPFIADRALAEEALTLIAHHGADARAEAARRVRESRDRGNIVRFCRLRALERLIEAMNAPPARPH